MNVLIYSGTGTSKIALTRTYQSLLRMVVPHYALRYVDVRTLDNEPWTSSTALLVIPGGRDLGYCKDFTEKTYQKVKEFVRRGGSYLGICAGGYFASGKVDFRMEDSKLNVVGPRKLAFFPGTCKGPTYPGFVYDSESGARAAPLALSPDLSVPGATDGIVKIYWNGGGSFVDAHKYENVRILARYNDLPESQNNEQASVISMNVGRGRVILTGVHPEFETDGCEGHEKRDETLRLEFLRCLLQDLNIKINEDYNSEQWKPSLHYLITSDFHSSLPDLAVLFEQESRNVLRDKRYTFHFNAAASAEITTGEASTLNNDEEEDRTMLSIHSCTPSKATELFSQHFDYQLYDRCLGDCDFGRPFLYAPVTTSTQSLLDQNTGFLSTLPTGFTACADHQLNGRGRGQNMFVSPPGILAFSYVVRISSTQFSTVPVALIQYLVSLAVVESIHGYAPGFDKLPVFIKWPNDVYVQVSDNEKLPKSEQYKKLSGVIVTTNYSNNELFLVVGCGVNVDNTGPTTSLNAVVSQWNKTAKQAGHVALEKVRREKLLALFFHYFELYYNQLIHQGFSTILPVYYKNWLHTNQKVYLENGVPARIEGITTDCGLLIAQPITEDGRPIGVKVILQPDGNSFDFMRNLITKK
ncbi:biotin-protein ligase [Schizosaccharomyces japonicus yFS275]|uniref:Biotin-protein ligase n=1 Tax=Schizosaccharomyces japonicus (strain yFS275 / FY16936) TaxID=402676 RepID=B6K387_SCHJY|nr:biotin-protein ligase [Schizosaccharomyces japonicus yFS275]EEB07944.1 biotin-protein ligase [Schizosaccharomyces japonicus yFS275]